MHLDATINLFDSACQVRQIGVNAKPDRCPRCSEFLSIEVLGAVLTGGKFDTHRDAVAVCQCSSIICRKIFTVFYSLVTENGVETGRLLQNRPLEFTQAANFSEVIANLSLTFCATYAQATRAEENGLNEICGAGYRRALEFLCKDYALSRIANDVAREAVIRSTLGRCIQEYLPQPIREAAARAAWIGNDEAHYYRVWTERDLQDLKALIQLTAKSIDFAIELEHYVLTMPHPKP